MADKAHATGRQEEQVDKLKVDGQAKKLLASRVSGVVKWFSSKLGYGFIKRNDNGEDLFMYNSAIIKNNPRKVSRSVADGEEVLFDVVLTKKGPEAANISGLNGEAVKGSQFVAEKRHFRVHVWSGHGQGDGMRVEAKKEGEGVREIPVIGSPGRGASTSRSRGRRSGITTTTRNRGNRDGRGTSTESQGIADGTTLDSKEVGVGAEGSGEGNQVAGRGGRGRPSRGGRGGGKFFVRGGRGGGRPAILGGTEEVAVNDGGRSVEGATRGPGRRGNRTGRSRTASGHGPITTIVSPGNGGEETTHSGGMRGSGRGKRIDRGSKKVIYLLTNPCTSSTGNSSTEPVMKKQDSDNGEMDSTPTTKTES